MTALKYQTMGLMLTILHREQIFAMRLQLCCCSKVQNILGPAEILAGCAPPHRNPRLPLPNGYTEYRCTSD
jgi:hypothetical protein